MAPSGWMRTTAGNPGAAAPAGRPRPALASHTRAVPSFPGFQLRPPLTRGAPAPSATRTSDAGGRDSPCAGHVRAPRAATRAASRHPGIAVQARRAAIRRGRPSRKQRQAPPGQPGQPGAQRPGAQPVPSCDPRPGPAAPGGRRPAPVADRKPARPQAPASSASPHPHMARDGREPHPPASRCGRSKERTRPWSVAAVAENPGRTVLPACGSRGLAGACPRVRQRRGSRPWSSSSPKESPQLPLGPLEITRLEVC